VGVLFVATGVGSGTGTATSRNTGNYNVASGYRSLYYNTTGYWNTASGFASLYLNTTGAKNAASGSSSLYWNTTGSSNTASGFASLYNNTTGHSNTANGYESLHYNLTGHHNTASGLYSLRYNTTGSYNTASGYKSLHNSGKIVTAGSFVVGVAYTIQSVGTTDFTAIGASANTVGVVFTATGVGSGTGTASSNSGSSNNTALGHAAGANITTGSSNIIIGANVEAPSATGDNQLNIGNTIYGDTSTGNVEINGSIKISDDTRAANTAGAGTLRWNSGILQNSDGTEWVDVNNYVPAPDGSTAYNMGTLSELTSFYSSGLVDLWVNIAETAILCKVDFDTPSGPWILMNFDMTTGSITNQNGNVFMQGNAANNNPVSSSQRYNDTANINLGDGTLGLRYLYNDTALPVGTSMTSEGMVACETGIYGPYTINYYNHGTGSNFTSAEKLALQGWVTDMRDTIPHLAIEEDSQGLTSADAWNNQAGPNSDSGHQLWLQDKDGYWIRATRRDNSVDESFSWYTWSDAVFNEGVSSGGTLSGNHSGGTPTGLGYGTMIMPESITVTTGTGGGTLFGTPYVRNLNNKINGRVYYLIKGA